MTPEQMLGLGIALLVMLVGTVGTLLPVIPGTPLLLVAAIAHKIFFGSSSAGWLVMTILVVLTALSFVVDYAGQALGAKKFGASWKGITGAIIGGLIGLFFGIVGILLGPFVGAMLFELIGGNAFKPAAKAGTGAVLGLLLGAAGKVAICVAMMMLFAFAVVHNSA